MICAIVLPSVSRIIWIYFPSTHATHAVLVSGWCAAECLLVLSVFARLVVASSAMTLDFEVVMEAFQLVANQKMNADRRR